MEACDQWCASGIRDPLLFIICIYTYYLSDENVDGMIRTFADDTKSGDVVYIEKNGLILQQDLDQLAKMGQGMARWKSTWTSAE